jgi:putative hydrolase of the HAD superfamily
MPIRAIIFDIGGVLVHEMDLDLNGEWDERLDLRSGELTQRFIESGVPQLALTGKISQYEAWRRIEAFMNFTDEQMHEYKDKLWAQTYLYTDMAQFLKKLHSFYKTATLSNDWQGAREENNRRFGLSDAIHVDEMIYSAEEGIAKPDVRIYQLACDRLGVPPKETLFLDNSDICVKTAQQIGMLAIQFKSSIRAIRDIQVVLERERV